MERGMEVWVRRGGDGGLQMQLVERRGGGKIALASSSPQGCTGSSRCRGGGFPAARRLCSCDQWRDVRSYANLDSGCDNAAIRVYNKTSEEAMVLAKGLPFSMVARALARCSEGAHVCNRFL
eukprot:766724-Hanusia_phi.AAC.5